MVVAASVDTEEVVKMSIKESEVTFPVGYGVDPAGISELTGAFYQEDPGERERPFLHTTNFLLPRPVAFRLPERRGYPATAKQN